MSFITNVAALIFKKKFSQKLDSIEIDIVNFRNISEKITLSDNPTEKKFITDNAFDLPTEISINATISRFSLNNSKIKQISSLVSGNIPNRLKEVHDEIYRIKNDKEPITIVTKFKEYKNMVLTNLEFPSNPNEGEVLNFNCVFKEVNIVSSQLVSLENSLISVDNQKKESSFGRQVGEIEDFTPKSEITLTQFIKSLF